MKLPIAHVVLIPAVILAVACAKRDEAEDPSDASRLAPLSSSTASDERTQVSVDADLLELCALPRPTFDFDRSMVAGAAAPELKLLAACLTTGPAKDVRVALVGHADSRGEVEYNFGLGQRRSGAIAQFLIDNGVEPSRLATSSRGELEATGSDEEGWAQDRRVELSIQR